MRLVFMGTPEFSVPSLEALLDSGHQVDLVVTQADKPKGRGKRPAAPPVKEVALAQGIPVLQPARLKDPDFLWRLQAAAPEAIVVVAYGKILPAAVLSLPPYGCINVHASLLPRYRGAAPIQRAIMNGERETGITTMLMDEGMDTGDILLQRRVAIGEEENFGSLCQRLARLGAQVLLETLERLQAGTLRRQPQDHAQATYAPPLTPEDELIVWDRPGEVIKNQVRALDPKPGAKTYFGGEVLKIWRVKAVTGDFPGVPGEIIAVGPEGIKVQVADGAVVILELQAAGGRRLPVDAFLRGHSIPEGYVLGK
ncbi:methionyl-tRNA formyltransferase [Thermodesulfitimonas autotrophica]|uniref:Methionyl-tRNA formyltransferase n=1 Tax=Thermodesulfitimonas autotrophica TaxID=1894989 RepID=A0A3N5BZJ3_9THEO|nr:methionyl-tRNA formyltransferase [Thermodesulfitimonas autotrophica]RPF49301.1 methionyl-tRNA formyltransferase [Thermodesulfitimonas autotrophica]